VLYQVCLKRGLPEDAIYIDRLEPRALAPWEAEEVDAPFDSDIDGDKGTVSLRTPLTR
jgi:hypothetical protein